MIATYRNADEALRGMSHRLLENGQEVGSRLGERTMERLMVQVTLAHPTERYITLPGRRVNLAAQIAETMWVLSGRDDLDFLSRYLPRAAEFSDDGETWRGAYGPRLRAWSISGQHRHGHPGPHEHVDQLAHVVDLLRREPGTRRAVMAIYDPATDTAPGKDIPCNDFIQFISRGGQVHGHVFTRSNDLWWGWSGINAFEWSALLEIVAGLVGQDVGSLTFSVTSMHLYDRHWKRARELHSSVEHDSDSGARFNAAAVIPGRVGRLDRVMERWMDVERAIREDSERFETRNVSNGTWARIVHFPEPMLREWLMVIAHYWSGNEAYLEQVGAVVRRCALLAPTPAHRKPSTESEVINTEAANDRRSDNPFVLAVSELHAEKHAAYGDSWKKRGELLSILPNIARKVDRLGQGETSDETQVDTAVDLLVYLVKYRLWLIENASAAPIKYAGGDEVSAVGVVLRDIGTSVDHSGFGSAPLDRLTMFVKDAADKYLDRATARIQDPSRWRDVDDLLAASYVLARRMWQRQGAK